ncbi:MAG: winged helix-turn-helix domain-containing protein [Candidatus Hadarchaeales archaeon]
MRKKALWLIFQEKPSRLLLFLKETGKKVYQTEISKKIDATFAHTLRILENMEKAGLIRSEKEGKVKYIYLTDVGSEVAAQIETIRRLIEISEIEQKITNIYESTVRGKLPTEIDREAVKREYIGLKRKLATFFSDPNHFIALKSRKVAAKIDMILAEVLGLPPGTEFTLQE